MPNPVQTTCAPSPTSPCRVFISYSRTDSSLAEEFFEHLESRFRNEDSPYGPGQIFFDRRDIQAGDLWENEILPALDSADVVILLVSVHSFKCRYCWIHEVPKAVAAGKRIIPVLLSPCSWAGMPIGEGDRSTTLGKLAAVPVLVLKGERNLVPVTQGVSDRHQRDERWLACVDQFVAALKESRVQDGAAALKSSAPSPSQRRTFRPELPILCDQDPAQDQLRKSVGPESMQKALFVLIQGDADDHPLDFWTRIIGHELPEIEPWHSVRFREAQRRHHLSRVPARPVFRTLMDKLGSFLRGGDRREVGQKGLRQQVLRDLFTTLTRHVDPSAEGSVPASAQAAAELAYDLRLKTFLEQQEGTQPVHCLLAAMSAAEAVASIGALAVAVAELSEIAPVDRLAFGFIWRGQEDLAEEFARVVQEVPRPICHAVALPRLRTFDRVQVQDWLRTHKLNQSLDESSFLDHAFADGRSEIRFRHLFDSYQAFTHP